MAEGKMANGKNGRGKKWPMEKGRRKKRKNNNFESNFLPTANIFVKFFFTNTEFNLWNNFIRIIWLDNLLMFSKATSVYHSGDCAPKTPTRGGSTPRTSFNFRACSAGYLTQKNSQVWRWGSFSFFSHFFPRPFFSSVIFFFGHFFPRPFFPGHLSPGFFFPIPSYINCSGYCAVILKE